jgi:hypothetical protein
MAKAAVLVAVAAPAPAIAQLDTAALATRQVSRQAKEIMAATAVQEALPLAVAVAAVHPLSAAQEQIRPAAAVATAPLQ